MFCYSLAKLRLILRRYFALSRMWGACHNQEGRRKTVLCSLFPRWLFKQLWFYYYVFFLIYFGHFMLWFYFCLICPHLQSCAREVIWSDWNLMNFNQFAPFHYSILFIESWAKCNTCKNRSTRRLSTIQTKQKYPKIRCRQKSNAFPPSFVLCVCVFSWFSCQILYDQTAVAILILIHFCISLSGLASENEHFISAHQTHTHDTISNKTEMMREMQMEKKQNKNFIHSVTLGRCAATVVVIAARMLMLVAVLVVSARMKYTRARKFCFVFFYYFFISMWWIFRKQSSMCQFVSLSQAYKKIHYSFFTVFSSHFVQVFFSLSLFSGYFFSDFSFCVKFMKLLFIFALVLVFASPASKK